jgi:hypothetical protein
MLENIAYNVIIPCNEKAAVAIGRLNEQTQYFSREPSSESLAATQTAWIAARYAWAYCELYDLAGLELSILHHKLDKLLNSSKMQDILDSNETISSDFIEAQGSMVKGFRVVERLLFRDEEQQTVLEAFQNDRRQAYLQALTENLENQIKLILAFWTPEGDHFAASFAAADSADGSVKSSINKTLNCFFHSSFCIPSALAIHWAKLSGQDRDPILPWPMPVRAPTRLLKAICAVSLTPLKGVKVQASMTILSQWNSKNSQRPSLTN